MSARQAVPYLLASDIAKEPADEKDEQAHVAPNEPPAEVARSLPKMPPVGSRLYSPSHTDKMEVTGGADLLIETIQQKDIARMWKEQKSNTSNKT